MGFDFDVRQGLGGTMDMITLLNTVNFAAKVGAFICGCDIVPLGRRHRAAADLDLDDRPLTSTWTSRSIAISGERISMRPRSELSRVSTAIGNFMLT
jgi:hypothetical protein